MSALPSDIPKDAADGLLKLGLSFLSADSSGGISELGKEFGDYELIEEIGHGGMGVIYKAWQVSAKREVALKILIAGYLASASQVQRFLNEAETAAKMQHPHIVPIFDVGQVEGQHYIAMRYVEGEALDQLIEREPIEGSDSIAIELLRKRVELLKQIAAATHHAHQHGILHRDLKPSNVLLDREGVPYLTDFGVAKNLDDSLNITRTQGIIGTPAYLAPEQIDEDLAELTTQADVYGLGVLLYETFTGQLPITGEGVNVYRRVLEVVPSAPSSLNKLIDVDLDTIVLKCIEKAPADRYASANQLVSDLGRWLEGRPIEARRINSFERLTKFAKRNPMVAVASATGAVLLMSFIIGLVLFSQRLSQANDQILLRSEEAEMARAKSERSAEENRQLVIEQRAQLVSSIEDVALQQMMKGDPIAALPHLMQVLKMEKGDAEREHVQRMRIAHALHRAPKLIASEEASEVGRQWRSLDEQRVLYTEDGKWRLWHADKGRQESPWKAVTNHRIVALSGNGQVACVEVPESGLFIYYLDGRPARKVTLPGQAATQLKLNEAGSAIAVLQQDRGLSLLQIEQGKWSPPNKKVSTLELFRWARSGVSCVVQQKDSNFWITSYIEGKWSTQYYAADDAELYTAVSRSIAGGQSKKQGKQSKRGYNLVGTGLPRRGIVHLEASDDADSFLIGGDEWVCKVNAVSKSLNLLKIFVQARSSIRKLDYLPSGNKILVGYSHGGVEMFAADSAESLKMYRFHTDPITSIDHEEQGKYFVTACEGGKAVVWSTRFGMPLCAPLNHGAPITNVVMLGDNKVMVMSDKRIQTWRFLDTLAWPNEVVFKKRNTHIAIEAKGSRYMLKDERGGLVLRDYKDVGMKGRSNSGFPNVKWKKLRTGVTKATSKNEEIHAVAMGSSVSLKNTAGEILGRSISHQGKVTFVGFSNDGKVLITGTEIGSVQLWDVATQKPLGATIEVAHPIQDCFLCPAGDAIGVLSSEPRMTWWKVGAAKLDTKALSSITNSLNGIDPNVSTEAMVEKSNDAWEERVRLWRTQLRRYHVIKK